MMTELMHQSAAAPSSVAVDGVSVTFSHHGEVAALADISFAVRPGEFVSIVGPSGCGKTTLLRVLAGVQQPTQGSVRIGSSDGGGPGVVFQESALLPWRTLLDNVALGLRAKGMSKRERHSVARELVELVGLSEFAERYPHELSGGMKQRVNLARALAIDPEVLLMDEPFASLDSQTRELMQEELLRIWDKTNKTVLFITHQIDEAVFLSDRVLIFSGRPGRVKETMSIDLERPRPLEVKRSPRFLGYLDGIWDLLKADILRAATE